MAKKKDFLHIAIKGDIPTAVDEYCDAMRINLKDIGFHMGTLAGTNSDLEKPLGILMQVHFFAGLHYAFTHKDSVKFKNVTEEEWNKIREEIVEKQTGENRTDRVQYMG